MSDPDRSASPIKEFHSRANWLASDIQSAEDWQRRLSEAEVLELKAAAEASRGLKDHELNTDNCPLPNLAPVCADIRESLERSWGVFQWSGFDVTQSLGDLQRQLLILGLHLGNPVSQTDKGQRIFHVTDTGYPADHPKARGPNSRRALSFHSDRADVIGFLCVRGALEGGRNALVSAQAIHNAMAREHPDLLRQLYQPFFYRRHNVDLGNSKPYYQMPVFAIEQGHFVANILRVLIERAYALPELPDMTDLQRRALDKLAELCEQQPFTWRFMQQPGQLLLINNYVIFHSREAFRDDPEQARLLLRLWLAMPNSRPLPALFRDHYQATEAGAIRGGMRVRTEAREDS